MLDYLIITVLRRFQQSENRTVQAVINSWQILRKFLYCIRLYDYRPTQKRLPTPIFYYYALYVDHVTLVYPGSVKYKLFAGDLKIYSNVDSLNPHTALCELERWCHMWQLQVYVGLHVSKNPSGASWC